MHTTHVYHYYSTTTPLLHHYYTTTTPLLHYYTRTGLLELAQQAYIQTPTVTDTNSHNAHIFFILLPNPLLRCRVQEALAAAGVSAFAHYEPLHSAPAGLKYGRVVGSMDVTDHISASLLRLPMWIDLTDEQIQFVIETVKLSVMQYVML
jgi:dTDP-4-amino-4,6-dideoxygalactose transaminase